ncbi:endonuclease/exonuclease/phosphatase family protein [Lentilactobacillus sp. Marseille-Q4993]|uniref:endonuclease/exonuclease/phosphatase family protein n=1 Tax=Lentilactobacillus sp. Marseille-Q4993 TaxID=3039492 RepID=UPI0024BC78F5|nr:endonuclease/exonuclease/phosphatase family protein [Lentilactobacillus sp. Marseille-Q4993]
MKVISWNCNGGFTHKYSDLIKYDADLYLVQEVEYTKKWVKLPGFPVDNFIYTEKANDVYEDKKGVLAFSFQKEKIHVDSHFEDLDMRYYQYVRFKGFRVLNIWTHSKYIEDLYSLTKLNQKELFRDDNLLMMGDFNSNAIWDGKHTFRSQTDFNNLAESYGYRSAYHESNHEKFGEETEDTFRLYRHKDKPFYIDYAFAKKSRIVEAKVIHNLDELSDHSALEIELL